MSETPLSLTLSCLRGAGRRRFRFKMDSITYPPIRRNAASEAAEKLLRVTISDPNDLRSALLYEQAALSFLLVKSGGAHVRKYALHLVHAGHRFLKAGLKAHGLRCYLSALRVYQDKRWTHVDDHLYSALAKHSISTQARFNTLCPIPDTRDPMPYGPEANPWSAPASPRPLHPSTRASPDPYICPPLHPPTPAYRPR